MIFTVPTIAASEAGQRNRLVYSGEHLTPEQVIGIAREQNPKGINYFKECVISGGDIVILAEVKFTPEGELRRVRETNVIHLPNIEETRRVIHRAFYGETPQQWTTIEGLFNESPKRRGFVYSEILLKQPRIHDEVRDILSQHPEYQNRDGFFGYDITEFVSVDDQQTLHQQRVNELFNLLGGFKECIECTHGLLRDVNLPQGVVIARPQGEFLKYIRSERT